MDVLQIAPRIADLAAVAGDKIMAVYAETDVGISSKADDSPLTRADLASHHAIIAGLRTITPGIPVLSEEAADIAYAERQAWSRFWLVDPLDGTKEFINRNGEFTVNIALIEAGRPVLGVVYAPVLGSLYVGIAGNGAYKQTGGTRTPIRVTGYDGGAIRVVASRSHNSESVTRFLNQIGPVECVNMGSSLKLCLVAEGSADLYPRIGPTMEWDTAAAHCVVEAAGGTVTDLTGERLRYNKPDLHNPHFVVAGSPAFPWQKYLA